MATRLASQRPNLITVTQIPSQQPLEANITTNENCETETIDRDIVSPCAAEGNIKENLNSEKTDSVPSASVSSLTLQQVIRQVCTKKKVLLQAGNDGEISVIDIVPIDTTRSSESNPITVSLEAQSDHTPQVTAQVAVVQAQSSTDNGPHYITVTAEGTVRSYAPLSAVVSSPQDNLGNSQGTYHLQYVDSELYPSSQTQTQMAYPVYAVSDYPTSGQQYYATNGNNYSATSSTNTGHVTGQYIVPVDEAILTAGSRDSPPIISTDMNSYIQSQTSQGNASTSENESPPNLTHATRVSPATVAWLMENYETAEGVSLPRSTLYNHYMKHCNENKLDAVNAASFGKLIRSVFMGLRTRRLGTRGNSKYHYYGIRIKPGSNLNNAVDEKPVVQNQPTQPTSRTTKRGGKAESYETCAQYLGDGARAIPEFPTINTSSSLGFDLTLDDIDTFRSIYREHCEAFLDAIVNLEFSTIEQLWREFWRAQDNNNMEECEEEKYLSKTKLFSLCQLKKVQDFMKQVDLTFYQNLVDVLIPNVLRPIPSSLTQAVRNFSKNLETWLTAAMNGCPEEVCKVKMASVSAFSQTLRRYTSLNHLAQAARAVLQNGSQIAQMLNDLNRVDFNNVQEQASWVCQCDPLLVQQLENDFKQALQQQNTLEQWASWLRYVVDTVLDDHRGRNSFPKAARQFLLKWSFYSSMVIRDLTLRSAASFGSFHLIRLLYDEYMFYIVEHKVAEATQTTPIAVMSSFGALSLENNHDEFGVTPYSSQEFEIKMEPCSKRMRSS